MLFRMYDQARSGDEKREVIHALNEGMTYPSSAAYGAPLANMVLDDTRRIVEFFADRAEAEQFEIVQTLEDHFLWLYRRTRDQASAQSKEHAETASKANGVLGAIERFRDRANSQDRVVRFKTLVGYQSVFPPHWDGNPMDIEGPQTYRAARIAEYVASVTDETANDWYEVVKRCAAVRSNDMAMFLSFTEFLEQLAARKPDIVLAYLKRGDALAMFLPAVLAGLAASSKPFLATDLMEEWIAQEQHLAAIARHLRLTRGGAEDLLRKVGEKAIARKDSIAITEVIAAIVANDSVKLVNSILVAGIEHLTSTNDTRWVAGVWFMPELMAFISKLTQPQCEALLDNLVLCRRIDYDEDRILAAIGQRFPAPVWRFLKQRLDRDKEEKDVIRYEAVPHGLGDLRKPLARDLALAMTTVREWYTQDNLLFQYRGGRVFHDVFPRIEPEIEAPLMSIVREGADEAIDFLLKILRTYQGEPFVLGLCGAIVDALPKDDQRLSEVEIILQSTGVVSGQFGFVEAYQRKKEEISPWLSDQRPKVRAFAERYIRTLDRTIAAEARRSESDYELRRLEWPE